MNVVLAMVPLVVAFVMLALLQQSGVRAGLATLATALAIALLVPGFHLALDQAALAAAQGAATSLAVLYVLFPALLLYQLQRVSGNIGVLAHATTRLCPDRDVQVLLLVLGLSPLIESVSLLSRLVPPFQLWLQAQGVLTVPSIGLHFQFLYNPGFYLLLGALTALLYLGPKAREFPTVLLRTLQQFTPGAVSIVSFLAASQIMGASGMIGVLGSAAAALGGGYSWIAPWLGALGGWLTGSNAGGNAMFARLQQETSIRAGLPVHWVMGAQNSAASITTMISPARMVLATSTTGITGQEGQLLRRVGPLVLAAVLLISLVLFGIVLAKVSASTVEISSGNLGVPLFCAIMAI